MKPNNDRFSRRVFLSRLILRGGWSGIFLLVVGAFLYHWQPSPVAASFPGAIPLFRSLLALQANGFLHAGILMLMVTPLLSLAFVCFLALYRRDWRLGIVTISLLGILILTVVIHLFT